MWFTILQVLIRGSCKVVLDVEVSHCYVGLGEWKFLDGVWLVVSASLCRRSDRALELGFVEPLVVHGVYVYGRCFHIGSC